MFRGAFRVRGAPALSVALRLCELVITAVGQNCDIHFLSEDDAGVYVKGLHRVTQTRFNYAMHVKRAVTTTIIITLHTHTNNNNADSVLCFYSNIFGKILSSLLCNDSLRDITGCILLDLLGAL